MKLDSLDEMVESGASPLVLRTKGGCIKLGVDVQ